MRNRRLNLKKETLVELSTEELDIAVGGNEITKSQCISGIVSCITYNCPTRRDCVATLEGC